MKTKLRRLSIDRKNGWTKLALRLGNRGWTARATGRACNLTEDQVRGTWRKYGVSPLDARRGESADEKRFLQATRRMINEADATLAVRAPQVSVWS